MKGKNAEYQAGAAIVDEGIKFKIEKVFGIPVELTIKPQRPGSIVRISQKVTQMDEVKEGTIQEYLEKGKNIDIIAGIIATAIINREFFKMWKYRWYKWLLLNRVKNMEYLFSYFLLVQRQMDPVFFYRIMDLTPSMNFLKKKKKQENTKEGKPYGEASPLSRKPYVSAAQGS